MSNFNGPHYQIFSQSRKRGETSHMNQMWWNTCESSLMRPDLQLRSYDASHSMKIHQKVYIDTFQLCCCFPNFVDIFDNLSSLPSSAHHFHCQCSSSAMSYYKEKKHTVRAAGAVTWARWHVDLCTCVWFFCHSPVCHPVCQRGYCYSCTPQLWPQPRPLLLPCLLTQC